MRCVSLDCPWLFQRKKVEQQAEDMKMLQELIQALELGDDAILGRPVRHDGSGEEPREDDREMINPRIFSSWDEIVEGDEL